MSDSPVQVSDLQIRHLNLQIRHPNFITGRYPEQTNIRNLFEQSNAFTGSIAMVYCRYTYAAPLVSDSFTPLVPFFSICLQGYKKTNQKLYQKNESVKE